MPGNAVPFNGRGKGQLALERPASAMRDFSRAIVLNARRMAEAYANRAEALMALRRYTDAVNDYSSAHRVRHGDGCRLSSAGAAAYTSLNKPWKGYADLDRGERTRRGLGAGGGRTDRFAPRKAPRLHPLRIVLDEGNRPILATGRRSLAQVADDSPFLPRRTRSCFAPATRS